MGLVALGFSLTGLYHRPSAAPREPRLQGGDQGDEKKPRFFSISVVDRS